MSSSVEPRRILVTGANGFIGSHLIQALTDTGADVHAMIRSQCDTSRWAQLGITPKTVVADITDHGAVARIAGTLRPSIVFNLATSRQQTDTALMAATNKAGALNLLEACAGRGLERFVMIGSALEAEGPGPGGARTPYGESRAMAAQALHDRATVLDAPFAYLRAGYVYGPLHAADKLIPTALRAARDKSPMPIVPTRIRRDFVHVADVVSACLLTLAPDVARRLVVDLAAHRPHSAKEVLDMLSGLLGTTIDTVEDDRLIRDWDSPASPTDGAAAKALLNWEPQISLRAGLQGLIANTGRNDAS